MYELAGQLTRGVLNEMKKRIQTSNIKKQKLELDENSQRMKEFFEREINRYERRKQTTLANQQRNVGEVERLQDALTRKEAECGGIEKNY